MALSAKLQVRQTQSLVITPQLMQAIRLLQMSGLELERFIAAELEQNPLLEQAETAERSDGADDDAAAPEARPRRRHRRRAGGRVSRAGGLRRGLSPHTDLVAHGSGSSVDWDEFSADQNLAATESLAELLERRRSTWPSPRRRRIG